MLTKVKTNQVDIISYVNMLYLYLDLPLIYEFFMPKLGLILLWVQLSVASA